MISRRKTTRHNRGRISANTGGGTAPPPPWTPADITSVTKYFWLRADSGTTIVTGVSAWADRYLLNNATQANAAAQPLLTASDAAFDNQASITFDGTDDALVFTGLDLPAPGTTPFWVWIIFRQLSWTSLDWVFAAGNNTVALQQFTADPQLRIINGTAVSSNSGAPTGTTVRGIASFTNSAADYLKLASTTVTGATSGNNDPVSGSFGLGARSAGLSGFCNVAIAEIIGLAGEPTELAQLEAYGAARYPSAVF